MSLVDLLRARAAELRPGAGYLFLPDGEREDRRITYADLDVRAREIAARLQGRALAGERALLLYPPGLEFLEAFFGCLYAGIVAVPAYPPRPNRSLARITSILESASPALILTTASLAEQAPGWADRIPGLAAAQWVATDEPSPAAAELWRQPEVTPQSLAFLQYTSGSTAAPKGVMVTHANLLDNQRRIQRAFRQTADSVVVSWLPPYHDMGLIGALLQPLFVGGSCVLMPPAAFLQKPLRWLQAISRYRATTSGGPDFAYALCVARTTSEQRRELDLASWQVAFNGAEPVRAATLARFAEALAPCGFRPEAFFPCYGLAEATLLAAAADDGGPRTVAVAGAELQRHRVVLDESGEGVLRLVGCGRSGEGARIVVADPQTRTPVPSNGVGEIWLSSPSVASGYWGQPEVSRETFAARLADGDGPFLRTGDLGFLLDGELFVTGRSKDLVIIRGRNYYPQDLELTAERSHPALRPGCGAAFSVTEGEELLVIVQEIDRRREAEAVEAAERIRSDIAGEHDLNPAEVVLIRAGSILKTSSGKIQRSACRDRYLQGGLEVVARSRAGGAETVPTPEEGPILEEEPPPLLVAALRRAAAGVLRRPAEELPVHLPLARLGLDSLAASELAGRIEEDLGRRVALPDLLADWSVRDLALELSAAAPGEPPRGGEEERPAETAAPLSYGQRALWYHWQLAPTSTAYHLAAAAILCGDVDREALRRAFQTLIDRHAALRTTIAPGADGEPVQQVRDTLPDGFSTVETAAGLDLDRLLEEEAARPFDLERGPLLRVLLVRCGELEHALLLVLHHVAADFWSLAVLADELGRLYSCFRGRLAAERAGLAPAPAPPLVHARRERERLAGPEGERLWAYWRRQLADAPQQLELPTDRRRPKLQGFRGGRVQATLGVPLSSRIAACGREAGATPFTTLLAGFALLLHRLSGAGDLLIGVPTAGREAAGLARAVGYYVNPLVVRSRAAAGAPFATGLADLRRTVLDAFAHRDAPFPWLAERLQPARDPGLSPLFQVMLVQQQAPGFAPDGLPGFALGRPGARLSLGELLLEAKPLSERSSQMDLALFAASVEDGLALGLQYDSDLFDATTARRLLSQLATLLDRATAEPGVPADALQLLTEAELHQVAWEWNDTAAGPLEAALHDLLAAQAARTPDAPAVVCGREQMTYRELDASASRLARVLVDLGVGPEERVGIFSGRSLDLVVGLLAVLKAGGAYVPLDPDYPEARLALMVEDSRPRVVLTQARLRDRLPACEGSQAVDLDGRWWEAGAPLPDRPARAGAGNLAYLIYTSGSTGRPKAVAIEHRSAVALCAWGRGAFSPEELAGVLAATSICFDLSVFELFVPLAWGGTVILVEDALALTAGLPAAEVRLINTVPTVMAEVVRAGVVPASTVTVALAGEVLHGSLVREIYRHPGVRRVLNLYGPSESTTYATGAEPARDEERPSIGRPIDGTAALVLGPGLRPLPVGVPGELYLGGAGLARGYFGRLELTAERFVPDPVTGVAGGRLYRCGDLARYRPDGRLEFLGRVDHQVKVRGFRIELGEIEAALAEHPRVLEAMAVLVETGGERRLVAYASAPASPAPTAAELEAYLRSRLPTHAVPAALVVLVALPRSPGGKVDRRRLPVPEIAAASKEAAPRTPLEAVLAALWCEVLCLERVGIHDDFFALGGHSLLAARLSSRIRQSLGRDLPLAAVLAAPTVARLAQRLASAAAPAAPAAIPRGGPLPVSPAQRRLWFLDRLQLGRATYNLPLAVHLRGALDTPALHRALAEVSRRHESLRTTFGEAAGLPYQLVAPPGRVPLPFIDLSGLPEPGPEALKLGRCEAARPFDLAAGPLLRCLLLGLAADRHVLVLTLHHAVADGWSLDVLLDELGVLYGAFVAGAPSPLREPAVQPADCAAWEIERLAAGALADQAASWVRRLAGAPAAIDLPLDRARPAIPSGRGGTCGGLLPAAVWADLLRLARRHGVTPFMVLLAGWSALCHRITGQEDLVLGTPVAQRGRVELEGLIGLFLNTLPLRMTFGGGETVDGLVARSREVCLAAYAHGELPFDLLVEALRPGRAPSQNPLFNVLLVQEPAPRRRAVAGLELCPEPLSTGTAKLDLTLFAAERDGAVDLTLEFDRDLFDPASATRHLRQLGELLSAMAPGKDEPVAGLPLLAPAERHQLLVEANEWAAAPEPRGCLHELVETQVRRSPDRVAAAAAGEVLTYGQLERRAAGLARHLRSLGVGPEVPAGVFLERSPDLVVAILGILKAGGAYLPLDPAYPEARLRFMLEDAGAPVVLTRDVLASRLPAGPRCIFLDAVPDPDPAEEPAPERVGADNLAYLIYTSGSTGRPKGVAIRHGSAVALVEWAREAFAAEECEAVLGSTSLCFDLSVFELFVPLSRGGRVVLVRDALELLKRSEPVTLVNTVPSVLAALLEQGALPPSVCSVNLAGEALSAALVARLAGEPRVGRVRNLYGPSEDTTYSTWAEIQAAASGPPPIGRPLPGTSAHVLDRGLQPAPLGVPGELFLGGIGLARGYHRRPDLTAERFIPDPFGAPGARLYSTGDLVRRRPDGALDFLGRIDQQVKVRGFRIEPGEIEAALLAHGGVRQAAVVARREGAEEVRLIAYFVPAAATSPTATELRAFLRGRLPDSFLPASFVPLAALPLTPSGKLDRRALPDPGREAAGVEARVRGPVEEVLAAVWAEVLGREPGAGDDFFALGGHSLLAARVASRVRDTLGVELPLRGFFENPTLSGLARRVEELRRSGLSEDVPLSPSGKAGPAPLSSAQQRLWLLHRFAPGSPAYHIAGAVRLTGSLNPSVLAAAVASIAERQAALRTVFRLSPEGPVQVAQKGMVLQVPQVDLRHLPPERRGEEARRIAREEARRAFDLETGPPGRMALLRLASGEHLLLTTFHHIATDGWSFPILLRELAAFYAARLDGSPASLEELPVTYADYARWQRRQLETEAMRGHLAYWREQLGGSLPVLELPADRPRPKEPSQRGRRYSFLLDAGLPALLAAAGRRHGVSPFMVLLAAFQCLLRRYTREEDLLVGTPVANRERAEVEDLVGCFVNTLVLRTRLEAGVSFAGLLTRVRETILEAFDHQALPFERLVEELRPGRDLAFTPLFQVLFVVQNTPRRAASIPGLALTEEAVDTGTAKFDLTLTVEEPAAGPVAVIEYATDLFDAASIARLAGHFARLLEDALGAPGRRLDDLRLLGGTERHQVLAEWNDTRVERPPQLLHAFLARQRERTPGAAAVVCGIERVTYGELDRWANQIARHLQELGVGPGAVVGLCAERSLEMMAGLFGILKAGAAYLPFDPDAPEQRLASIAAEAGVSVLLAQERLAPVPPASPRVVYLDRHRDEIARQSPVDPGTAVEPDDVAYVLYSSGSTGRPKGIMNTHRAIANRLLWMQSAYGLTGEDRVLQKTPYGFDVSVWEFFWPSLVGARLVLAAPGGHRDPVYLRDLIRREGITVLHFVPSLLQLFLDQPDLSGCASLRLVVCSGEALPIALAQRCRERLPARLENLYGPTEAAVDVTSWHCVPREGERSVPIGRPIDNVHVVLLDEGGNPTPVGVPGELCIGGVAPACGYLARPDLTAAGFVPDPFAAEPGARLYRTGDLARRLTGGEIEFLGRLDFQVKIRGVRIEPGEIEAVLLTRPDVREAVVVARDGGRGELQLVAYLVPTAPPGPGAGELRSFLRERLPEAMVPAAFMTLPQLPLGRTGKVDRRALPSPEPTAARAQYVVPRTAVEEQLAALWTEVLGIEHAGISDNFFDLGGHSLLATQLLSRIKDTYHVELPLRDLFAAPTVEELALVVTHRIVELAGSDLIAQMLADVETVHEGYAE